MDLAAKSSFTLCALALTSCLLLGESFHLLVPLFPLLCTLDAAVLLSKQPGCSGRKPVGRSQVYYYQTYSKERKESPGSYSDSSTSLPRSPLSPGRVKSQAWEQQCYCLSKQTPPGQLGPCREVTMGASHAPLWVVGSKLMGVGKRQRFLQCVVCSLQCCSGRRGSPSPALRPAQRSSLSSQSQLPCRQSSREVMKTGRAKGKTKQ